MRSRHFRFNPQQQKFAVQLEMFGKCQKRTYYSGATVHRRVVGARRDRRAPLIARLGALCASAERVDSAQALVPRAFDMSARVAFSASLTCTPPMPRNPPSEEAFATF